MTPEPLPVPEAIVLDLDGVLADIDGRRPIARLEDLEAIAARRPVAVVTSCPRRLAESVLARHGFLPFVRAIVGLEDGPGKPSAAPVLLAMERVSAADAWMLGDNPSDVQAARSAGVVALAVRPLGIGAAGHTSRLIEAGADRLLDGIGELRRLLEELDDPA